MEGTAGSETALLSFELPLLPCSDGLVLSVNRLGDGVSLGRDLAMSDEFAVFILGRLDRGSGNVQHNDVAENLKITVDI